MILRSGRVSLEMKDILTFWTVVVLSLLKSEYRMELKIIARYIR